MKILEKKILIFVLILWILTILVIYLFNKLFIEEKSIMNNNLEKSFDFSKYYSDQCPEWEIMTSWIEYSDWTIKVYRCSGNFSCPKWKKIISQCSSMIWDVPCKIYCIWENELIPEW